MNDWLIFAAIVFMVVAILLYMQYRNVIAFWIAKHRARKKHLETGKRYYVIPGENKLHVVGSHQISRINRKLPERKRINIVKLLHDSYYHTK